MTDLDRIRKLILAFPIPFFLRGLIEGLTQEHIRKAYNEVGGEEGAKEVFAAFVRIGKTEEVT